MNRIKVIFIQVLVTFTLFFTVDYLYTDLFYLSKEEREKVYRTRHDIFGHTLSPSFDGLGIWGGQTYQVCTDANGFKSSCNDVSKSNRNFEIAFMGDSFTEAIGMKHEDSFVGMIANDNPNLRIANLGVSFYSPSSYYSKINWLLEKGYSFKHIYVFIDISDIG